MTPVLVTALRAVIALLVISRVASAEVVRIDVRSRDDFGTHERVIARVHYAVDPKLPVNQAIADLAFAPRNADGKVEFAGDLLLFLPKRAASARGTVFLEVVNRGRDQSLGLMSDARQRDLAPENWNLGDRFLLEQGFTVAFLGWQFDVQPGDGLSLTVPTAPVSGVVRASAVTVSRSGPGGAIGLAYCAADASQSDATLTFRSEIEKPATVVPRDSWQFAPDGCAVRRAAGFDAGLNEVIYKATGSPVAGLGLAAVRDFASYLKYGSGRRHAAREPGADATRHRLRLLAERTLPPRVRARRLQPGRTRPRGVRWPDGRVGRRRRRQLQSSIRDARDRPATPCSPSFGRWTFRRSPTTGCWRRRKTASVVPRIFYTFSSTEYWARAGSLTHTNETGTRRRPARPRRRVSTS